MPVCTLDFGPCLPAEARLGGPRDIGIEPNPISMLVHVTHVFPGCGEQLPPTLKQHAKIRPYDPVLHM